MTADHIGTREEAIARLRYEQAAHATTRAEACAIKGAADNDPRDAERIATDYGLAICRTELARVTAERDTARHYFAVETQALRAEVDAAAADRDALDSVLDEIIEYALDEDPPLSDVADLAEALRAHAKGQP